jgi:hypothetical protein
MSTAKGAARAAERSTALEVVARVGYVVLGILHIVIGVISISIATGGGGSADQGGAMEQIRQSPFGPFLLWLIALGLIALAIWQVAEAFLENNPDDKEKWGHRLKYIGTAVVYVAIAITAITFALGGQSDSSQSSQSFTAQLLASPGGIVLLWLVALLVFGIGVAFVVRGITRAFEKYLQFPNESARKGIVALGVVGYIAKGIAIGVTGILFAAAAVTHDPAKAGGLDAALHTLASLPFGVFILWLVGAGLVLYGIYCFARARYARM